MENALPQGRRLKIMLNYAWIFFVIAIIAAVFGFGDVAATAGIARTIFYIFMAFFVATLLFGRRSV